MSNVVLLFLFLFQAFIPLLFPFLPCVWEMLPHHKDPEAETSEGEIIYKHQCLNPIVMHCEVFFFCSDENT